LPVGPRRGRPLQQLVGQERETKLFARAGLHDQPEEFSEKPTTRKATADRADREEVNSAEPEVVRRSASQTRVGSHARRPVEDQPGNAISISLENQPEKMERGVAVRLTVVFSRGQ
jgi:hypothetical protein